jgi:hypothetical protein
VTNKASYRRGETKDIKDKAKIGGVKSQEKRRND